MNEKVIEKFNKLNSIFTPSSPIEQKELFAGRIEYIGKTIGIIKQPGRHIAIYGDRGVGKTSFANLIRIIMDSPKSITVKVSCASKDDFSMLWLKILDKIPISFSEKVRGIGFNSKVDEKNKTFIASSFFKDGNVDLKELLALFENIDKELLFIFDEFDRLPNSFDLTYFTDTIKAISDNYTNITIIIVGVAENIHEIIGEHQSIQRNLAQIHLPIMSKEELFEIIDKGEEKLEIKVEGSVKELIVDYSDGYPHYTHLLSFHAFNNAIVQELSIIKRKGFNYAIKEAIDEAHELLRNDYQKATLSTKRNIFKDVLWACAQVELDDNHSFQALDIQEKLSLILAKEMKVNQFGYHLGQLCTEDRGAILNSIGTRNRKRYKFRNPLMRPFIKMNIYKSQQSL